tara:strand:- start:8906 stop:9916 length:1011 start_codon:yes stop_codon:yes gene_type:complete
MDFSNKKIVITGGTGSFGNQMVDLFLSKNAKEIRIFSRDEKKQEEMRLKYNNANLKFFLGDIRDYQSVFNAVKDVDFVYHAAALKQVPSCEFYPLEAIKTNILGSENVMRACILGNVQKLILLSTDKAVYPINAMGMSKALMEKVMLSKTRTLDKNDTKICATRYGNVMCSRGSVIPLFISQILNNKPITITDPSMTRFLMSLKESVNLVMFAFEEGNSGDIFVQKSPACTIYDLANALRQIFNADNPIKIIGTRHGEKLYESLISRQEISRVEEFNNFYRIPPDDRELNYSQFFTEGKEKISESEDYTSHNTDRLNVSDIKSILLKDDYIKKFIS